jgi:hypothetical protein
VLQGGPLPPSACADTHPYPEKPFLSFEKMASATASAGVDISATVPWGIASSGTKYTRSFSLGRNNSAAFNDLFAWISVTGIGTAALTLEYSVDGTNFAGVQAAIAQNASNASTTTPQLLQAIYDRASLAATGDKYIRFENVPWAPYYRWKLVASSAACYIDVFTCAFR